MPTFLLALRNLILLRERHSLIALSILLISSLITLITGTLYGSLEAVKIKAGRYFAGTAAITGYEKMVHKISEPEALIKVLGDAKLPIRTASARSSSYNENALLFFNGETIRQRKLIGIDFFTEGAEFRTLAFREGGWESLSTPEGENGILISAPASRLLGCRVGDNITLSLTTDRGQYNSARLIVRGIFNETSLFGYVTYMRRVDLNRLLAREPGFATDIAVYAKDGINVERFAADIRGTLASRFDVFPLFSSREERDAALATNRIDGEKYVVLSQNAQLAEIKQLLDALRTVAYFTLAIFLVIVMVGILNTYRVLVHERTKEIGTLRAIGMGQIRVRALFLTEAALLALISSFAGLVFGILLFRLLALIDLSFIPAAGMFLERGHLRFSLNPLVMLLNLGVLVTAALLAAWGPSRHAARIEPAQALRSA